MTEHITEAVRQRAAELLIERREGAATMASARVEIDRHVDVLTAICQALEEAEKA